MDSECDDLKYIDDVPFSQYFAKFLDSCNRDQRKKNTQAIITFMEQLKESLVKNDDGLNSYSFSSSQVNLNQFAKTSKKHSKDITIENLVDNVNTRLTKNKKKFLNILCMSPNLDQISLDLVNKEVLGFMGTFFGRTDLGVSYQQDFEKELQIEKLEKNDQLLYKDTYWSEKGTGNQYGSKKVDKSVGAVFNNSLCIYFFYLISLYFFVYFIVFLKIVSLGSQRSSQG